MKKISVSGITISITLIMGTSTFLGYAFGVLGPDLIREFSLSRSELGLATTVSFVIGGFGSILAGRFVDKIGVRKITIYAMMIVAVSLLLISVTTNYLFILALSAFAGITLAFGNPITNKVIAHERNVDTFSCNDRRRWHSIYNSVLFRDFDIDFLVIRNIAKIYSRIKIIA
ncbi:MAG: MFS transporter [Flavobacteriaceae bacterium]|nr:MFS transporter [Flavobacteriaceae bacterium]